MSKKTVKIIITIIIVAIISLTALFNFLVFSSRFSKAGTITITKGEGLREIAGNLQKERIINSSLVFTAYAIVTNNAKYIRAGQYEFDRPINIPEVLETIVRGRVVDKEITIIEGWNLAEIGEYLKEKEVDDIEKFYQLAGKPLYLNKIAIASNCQELIGVGAYDYRNAYSFLVEKPDNVNMEGYLFPDTYKLPFDADAELVIKIMLDNFDKKLTSELRAEISRQNKSVNEIIIMASLLEKEVKTMSEKKVVSGILWKRLAIGMPLQVDSTILYSLGLQDRVSYIDTATCSPYNTYRRKGLPIGPISNPGIESIIAAIYPEKSEYLYYLSKKDGETLFSVTLQEHNIKKEKYLR